MSRIAILDYGMGNLRSVEKALGRVGAEAEITAEPERARAADGVILPGVGAFPRAMDRVRELGLNELVRERNEAGVPVLGICLGLQLLFDSSSENQGAEGIGLLPGRVEPPFYFVHSFTPAPRRGDDVLGTAAYGERFACAVERPPVYGVQFHPEKSSSAGLRLLANFAALCERSRAG
jgi:imidazole glycerol-phosphate synthase subunit HisH